MRRTPALSLTLSLTLLLAATASAARFDGESWWNIVKVLADDANEGRDTGSRGERAADDYVVARLRALGVRAAGSDGYFQPVEFTTRSIDEAASSIALVRHGRAAPVALGEDAVFTTRMPLAAAVEARLVFVGYGIEIDKLHYSDLKGSDLRGKIAVFITGSPADVPSALSAHAQARDERWQALRAAGAIGMISIQNPASMEKPWAATVLNRLHPSMALAAPEFSATAGCRFAASWNPAHAVALFAGSGHDFDTLVALATERKALPHFALPGRLRARAAVSSAAVSSRNIVAALDGSDPALKSSFVVLSAHIDHIGIGEPVAGDRIYNGAMDNGSGSALLLEVARVLAASPQKPRRSVLFVWVTGEEKGLLGSQYFATHPTVAASALIADINVDMFLPIIPLRLVTVYGLGESDLGERVTAVATRLGLAVQPDPLPLHNVFIRSDQYNFVRRGIPSLMLDVGAAPGSPEAATLVSWRRNRYHAPSDDTNQPVDLAAAAGFEELVTALVEEIANDPVAPHWKADSAFRAFAQAPGAP